MSVVDHVLKNPGLLKLELMRRGLRVAAEDLEAVRRSGADASGHAVFGNTWDLDVVLPRDTWASVPVHPRLAARSPYLLVRDGAGHHHVTTEAPDAPRTPVTVKPPARFFEHTTSEGIPFGRIGTVHGPYLALSPTNRCAFLDGPDRCRFCGVAPAGAHDALPVADVIEAVRVARGEHAVNMVHLSVGWLGGDDGGVALLEPYVAALKKHFDILVAIDTLPPRADAWIDRTYAMGADAVSYNLEIWDPARFERVCPGPARSLGRERFLDALGYATTVFPSGGVLCHLIVGLEPLASTRAGMTALAEAGVVPVLPVYRPFKGRDMRADGDIERFPPTLEELSELYRDLWSLVRRHKLGVHLVRDLATVTTPLEGRFFAGHDGLLRRIGHRLAGSRLGRRTSARLSDLRRALRVREVGAVER
ncbi:MAG: radical SAM protein [Deltaproteobacteria bacterium]|nr:MAG: radical SAM protein [Deltaproteobacteria bacterium]